MVLHMFVSEAIADRKTAMIRPPSIVPPRKPKTAINERSTVED